MLLFEFIKEMLELDAIVDRDQVRYHVIGSVEKTFISDNVTQALYPRWVQQTEYGKRRYCSWCNNAFLLLYSYIHRRKEHQPIPLEMSVSLSFSCH